MSEPNMSLEVLINVYEKVLSYIETYQDSTKRIHEDASTDFDRLRYKLHMPENASRKHNTVYQKKKTMQQAEINRLFSMLHALQTKTSPLYAQYSNLKNYATQANPSNSASLSKSTSMLKEVYNRLNDLTPAYRVVYDEQQRFFKEMERVETAHDRSVPFSIAEENENNAESSGGRRRKRTLRKKRALRKKRTRRSRA